nr:immunoglobulin heavy chain junction region [Mus musculus]
CARYYYGSSYIAYW